MPKSYPLLKIIRLFALAMLPFCLIVFSGCATPVIIIPKPTPEIIKEYKSFAVRAKRPGMIDTGVGVKWGDYVTILAKGEINTWPAKGKEYNFAPNQILLFKVGEKNFARRYFGAELVNIREVGNIYLGYAGDRVMDAYGEPGNSIYYSDDIGYFSVDIIVWKTEDIILMAKFFEEAFQRNPQNATLGEFTRKFEKRKSLFLAEQKIKKDVEEAKKALTDLKREEVTKPKEQEKKAAAPKPIVTTSKEKETPSMKDPEKGKQGLDPKSKISEDKKPAITPTIKETAKAAEPPKQIPAAIPKRQEEKQLSIPSKEKASPGTKDVIPAPQKGTPAIKDDEKETKIAELNERLQKAMQALNDLEEMKRQMADQQRKEAEVASRLQALEAEKMKPNLPVIAIANPKDGINVDSEYILLIGVAEHEKGITKFEILVNNEAVNPKDQRGVRLAPKEPRRIEFSERIRLREGKNAITIIATEKEGMTAEKSITVHMAKKKEEIWAVIIGINKYNHIPSLKYAVNDANEFYRYLTEVNRVPKDHIWLILDEEATLDRLRSVLGTQLRRKAGKDDMVIIYLAGHGATEKDASSLDGDGLEKYILPFNADPKDLYASAMPMGEVTRIFQRISSEKLVLLSDTCYSGASGGRTIPASGARANVSGAFLDRLSQGKGRMIITASDANQVSVEKDELKHGVFTYYLLEGLYGKADFDKDGLITLDEIYRYVSIKVPQATGQDQHPVKKGEMTGEIVLGVVKKP